MPTLLIDAKYSFIMSYLKSAEARMLKQEYANRLSSVSNINDAMRGLRDTDLGIYLEDVQIKSTEELDNYLWRYFYDCINRLEDFNFIPRDLQKMLQAYLVKYDIFNLKTALTVLITGKKIDMLQVGNFKNRNLLNQLAVSGSVEEIIQTTLECSLTEYSMVIAEHAGADISKSMHKLEVNLDEVYYRQLINTARDIKDISVLPQAFRVLVDIQNLQVICRAIIQNKGATALEYILSDGNTINKQLARELLSNKINGLSRLLSNTPYEQLLDELAGKYEQSKKATVVDEVLEKFKYRFLKELLSPQVFMPAMVIWYVIQKELEIRNLRLILKAFIDNVPPGEIVDFLVFV